MTKKANQQRYSDPCPKSIFTNKLLQKNKLQQISSKKDNNDKQMGLQNKLKSLKKKSAQSYHKIQKKIDKMIEILEEGERKMDIEENQEVAVQKCLNFIHNSFIYEKPLKSIKDDFIHFYKRLSSFSKQIIPADETIFQNNQFSLLLKSKQDLDHFQKCLQNHYFRKGQFEAGRCFKQNQKTDQNQQNFKNCYHISMRIKQSKYLQAIHWVQNLPARQKSKQICQFQYDLKKLQIINRLKQKNYKGAFKYFKDQMKIFMTTHQSQLKMLLCFILTSCEWNPNLLIRQQSQINLASDKKQHFSNMNSHNHNHSPFSHNIEHNNCTSCQKEKRKYQIEPEQQIQNHKQKNSLNDSLVNLKERYKFLVKENIEQYNSQMAERFACLFFQITGMSKFDTLAICYEVANQYKDKYLQLLGLLSKNQFKKIKKGEQKILPFSIEVQKQYHYHSLFLCPVTKDVLTSKQGVVLLQCGHLISEAATKLISQVRNRNSNKNKCPVCQKQRKQQPKRVYF